MDNFRGIRFAVSAVIGLVTLLAAMTYGCNAVDGVGIWERCTSFLGNPIPELHPLASLGIAIAVGALAWWVLGFTPLNPGGSGRGTSGRSPHDSGQ
ncbi:MAG: hypothetical protein P1T08_01090 [Acidimicrobiia bacterium]|nr:hypothetical protein [Acidimicrobiia bacterium]